MLASSLLLLPGMMLDRRMYEPQLSSLSGNFTTIVADLTRSSSIGQLAADVLRDAPPQFALIGLSMGGIVALEIWRRAPERVTQMGLLNTTAYADRPERRELRLEQIARVETGGLREVTASMKTLYLAKKNRGDQRLLQDIMDMGLDLGADVFRRQSLALRERSDNTDLLATITCPTLVLCGREDQLCPVDWHIAMANSIPRADLVILSECGHLSAMEEPDAVTAALIHLLRRPA
jgi:pimeloyl-ACP methyl ester carboxylesterase